MFFREKYQFLSNFYECQITIAIGSSMYTFKNAEAAFQAHKNYQLVDKFTNLSGTAAKKLGKTIEITTINWDEMRLYVMARVLYIKFSDSALLARLKNVDEDIYEDNYWHDTFWGRDVCTMKGENWLGRLLMVIRDTDNNLFKLLQYIDNNK